MDKYLEFQELDSLIKIIGPDVEIDWYTDMNKLKSELIDKFPEDQESLQKFFETIRAIYDEFQKLYFNPTFFKKLTCFLRFRKLLKYRNYTFKQFSDKFFKNEKLKEILGKSSLIIGMSDSRIPLLAYIHMIMVYTQGGSLYPKGGFQKISDTFVKCFKEYNGILRLKTKVKKIIIDNKRAVGVELETGEKVYGKYIISNADTKKTFFELIDKEHLKKKFLNKIEGLEQSCSGFVVKLVVRMDMSKLARHSFAIFFPEYGYTDKMFDLVSKNKIDINNFNFFIDISPHIDKEEKSEEFSIISLLLAPVPYDYKGKWFLDDKIKQKELKEEIANKLIKRAEEIIPNLSKNIVLKDIATPLTYERYTSATKGALLDIASTRKQARDNKMYPGSKIKGLYLTGAKSMPGAGIRLAMLGGLSTADKIAGVKKNIELI